MNIQILLELNQVIIDDQYMPKKDLSLCFPPANISALYWNDNAGWMVPRTQYDGKTPPSIEIHELPNWAKCCIGQAHGEIPDEPTE